MSSVLVEQNIPCRLRDGVTLRADVYRPAAPGRYPVVLTRLPYGKEIHPGGFSQLPLADLALLRELGLAGILQPALAAGPAHDFGISVDHGAVVVPSLNIGGWYDIFLQGTLDNFTGLRARGRGPGRQAHLYVGPWSHLNRTSAVGEPEFGLAAGAATLELMGDLTTLQLRWFDHWLKGADNGVDREPPVRVFTMGENVWRSLPAWLPAQAQAQDWFLHPGGSLSPQAPAAGAAPSRYTYDPADPAPTLGGHLLLPGRYGSGVKDQRPLAGRRDVLTFAGTPLDWPLMVMGRVTATLWASSSAPDTDFVVRLLDVHPDGFLQNIADGIVRARHRRPGAPELLAPGQVYEFPVDLWSVAHVFQPGHALAVQVTSSSFPRWDRHLNTAEPPGSGTAWQVAEQAIYHGGAYLSCLRLPVLP